MICSLWSFLGNMPGRTVFPEEEATAKGASSVLTAQTERRNNEMIAERHADRIFQVIYNHLTHFYLIGTNFDNF